MAEYAIEMRGMVKIYPGGTVALKGVDFAVREGEIHGLLGENGAGKTTLMEILYGTRSPTEGEIFVRGRRVEIRSPRDAMALGIGMVHQHFTLIPVFTALENVVLGDEPVRSAGLLDVQAARARVEELMDQTGLHVPLDEPVENLSTGERQRIEILKMLYRNADILILDEPTAVLTPLETKELFAFLKRMKEEGKTIVFITHKLREVKAITDRVTVLRRGEVVGTVDTAEVSMEELARMMVGREVLFELEKKPREPEEPKLTVEDLWVRGEGGDYAVKGVSFEVRGGEIFGIAGVEGNGQTELVEAITGLRLPDRGRVLLAGEDVTGARPHHLYARGLGHIPEDRHRRGIILEFTVAENSILGLQRLPPFMNKWGVLQESVVRDWARKVVERFEIDTPGIDAPASALSGGNQQKLIVGREIMKDPKVVVAAQPTRGLDVAATEYIRRTLLRMRDEGRAVLLVSADLDEVLMLSDRVGVMYEGELMGVVRPEEVTLEEIGMMMGGVRLEDIKGGGAKAEAESTGG